MQSRIKDTQPVYEVSGRDAPLVDAHAHVYTLDMPVVSTAWHRPVKDATSQAFVDELDRADVKYAVLAAASIYGDYNDYMLEAIAKYDRLRATVIVDPETDRQLLREMKEAGVVGVRLQFRNVASPPDLTSDVYRKFFSSVADLDWHVHLHDEGDRLPGVIEYLENAGPRLVIDHFGRPAAPEGINSQGFQCVLRAVEAGNTWVKLSGAFRLQEPGKAPAFAGELLKHAGAERLLWGSDWPFAAFENSMTYAKAIEQFQCNVPDPAIRKAIDRTAYDFYFR